MAEFLLDVVPLRIVDPLEDVERDESMLGLAPHVLAAMVTSRMVGPLENSSCGRLAALAAGVREAWIR